MEEEMDIQRYVHGDKNAFEAVVIRYRRPAIRFAVQLTGDYYTAEDLVQDVFAYLYVYPEKYEARASFKTYLFTLVRNKSIDYLRKTRRLIPDDDVASLMPAATDGESNPEAELLRSEQKHELYKHLQALRLDDRTAIYLVDLDGQSCGDAARIMNKNQAAFRVMLHRARKRLKRSYEEEGWNGGSDKAGSSLSG